MGLCHSSSGSQGRRTAHHGPQRPPEDSLVLAVDCSLALRAAMHCQPRRLKAVRTESNQSCRPTLRPVSSAKLTLALVESSEQSQVPEVGMKQQEQHVSICLPLHARMCTRRLQGLKAPVAALVRDLVPVAQADQQAARYILRLLARQRCHSARAFRLSAVVAKANSCTGLSGVGRRSTHRTGWQEATAQEGGHS